MTGVIPEPLQGYGLIRVRRQSKGPVVSPEHVELLPAIRRWVADGGNYGVRATAGDDLVIIDVDDGELRTALREPLPRMFMVETGSGGEHHYYRCSGWDRNHQLGRDGTDYGSLRASNWYAVGPGSVHPNGNRYRVVEDRPIATVSIPRLKELVERFGDSDGEGDTSATPSPRPRVGGHTVPDVPASYPSRSAEWSTCRNWLRSNGLLGRLSSTAGDDQSGDEFLLAKCLAEGGFSEGTIRSAMDRRPSSAKWHRRGERYRRLTVRKAIRAAVADDHVSFEED